MNSPRQAAVDSWRQLWARGTQPSSRPISPGRAPDHRKRKKTKKPPKYRRKQPTAPSPSSSLQQLDLHHNNQDITDMEEFGDVPLAPP